MVKFGKNKFKALNKLAKSKKIASASPGVSNKILKKKIIADKKIGFQQEVLLREAAQSSQNLVKNVTAKEIILRKSKRESKPKVEAVEKKIKQKSVEKQKKRQKTQINDTKLLLSLMKNKK